MIQMQSASERSIQEFMHGLVGIDCFCDAGELKGLMEWIERYYDGAPAVKEHLIKAFEYMRVNATAAQAKNKRDYPISGSYLNG